jgi:NAD(P)-dependent dehydrogenase (short-subunit alcohol dehydrogenase family)
MTTRTRASKNKLPAALGGFLKAQHFMTIKLTGKRALVTGGSSGIGNGIAFALAKAGAQVAITYRTHPRAAQAFVSAIKKRRGKALAIETDVSDPAAVISLFKQIDDAWGGIDILVNNAGMDGARAISWEADLPAWRKVIEVNLFGVFYCASEAMKRMVPQKQGVILNISSVHEEIAWSGYSAYTSSKAAVGMLAKTLAQEGAPHGVRVLSLAPGAIKTPINRSVWGDPKGLRDLEKKIPLNRIGKIDEVANMAVVLVSDAASYVTGRTIYVDGGMTDYPDFAHGG